MAEVLQGSARAWSLATLLQAAEQEAFTGRLRYAAEAEVSLLKGAPVSARAGGMTGLDALLELFLHTFERFSLETTAVADAPPLAITMGVVLDGCRLLDDWLRVESLVPGVVADATALPPALAPLAPFLDGRRSVRAAVDAAAVGRARVSLALVRAFEEGILVETGRVAESPSEEEPPRAEPVVADADDFDSAVFDGRRLAREGRFPEARSLFEKAVALRPDDRVAVQNLRRITLLMERA